MSIYREKRTGKWVIKIRESAGRQRTITVNPRNMAVYGLGSHSNVTLRVTHHFEWAVLAKSNSFNANHAGEYQLADVIRRFLETRVASNSYKYRFKLSLENYFLKFIGDGLVNNLGVEDIQRFRVHLVNGHTPTTVRDYLSEVKYFLRWTKKCGYITGDFLAEIKLPPRTRKAVEYLIPDQAQLLIKTVKGLTIEIPIIGILNLGLRRGEFINLEWHLQARRLQNVPFHRHKLIEEVADYLSVHFIKWFNRTGFLPSHKRRRFGK